MSAPRIALALGLCALACGGCLERRIQITSEPPGALVWVNDVEVGRTPTETSFTYYGVYDVRVRKDGYEPIVTSRKAKAPLYEYPPIDLLASATPADISTTVRWHFDLEPVPDAGDEAREAVETDLTERAREFRSRLGDPAPKAETNPGGAAGPER